VNTQRSVLNVAVRRIYGIEVLWDLIGGWLLAFGGWLLAFGLLAAHDDSS